MSRRTAIITASFAPDLERCRLLCETIDKHVTGFSKHYILVEHNDVSLFKQLESPHRVIIDEMDLFPKWIRAYPDPFYFGQRRIWLSLRTLPLRGWHAQQLRRIAIGEKIGEDALFYCDSDVAFLKPFDCASLWRDDDLRLFRRDNELLDKVPGDQHLWADNAAMLLGIKDAPLPPHGYVGTLIAWRRDRVLGMCRRIEEVSGLHWLEAIGRRRRFSECTIYGHFADDVERLAGHFIDTRDLCKVHWFAPAPTEAEFRAFIADMEPHQAAVGIQSFIGADIAYVRRLIGE
jgi:Family of unknown function (DUF6492)